MKMRIKRIISITIDFFIVMFIGIGIFVIIVEFFNITSKVLQDILQFILMSLLFFVKDLPYREGSLGKKICKLEVLKLNNERLSNLIKILRNTMILIWPVELVLLVLFNKRLGDIIFKTKVVEKQ